jgi:hypothetical protein
VPSDPHPLEPPPAAGLGDLPEARLGTGATLERIHPSEFGPIFFGRGKKHRFDDPEAEYGVLYAGLDSHCAFIETFGRVPSEGIVLRSALAARSISTLTAARELRLVDLRGHHLAQLRVDSKIFSYTDYDVTQRWSRAFFQHAQSVDGLIFHSRHDPLRHAVALFERAGPRAVDVQQTQGLLAPAFEPTLSEIVDLYRFAIV